MFIQIKPNVLINIASISAVVELDGMNWGEHSRYKHQVYLNHNNGTKSYGISEQTYNYLLYILPQLPKEPTK